MVKVLKYLEAICLHNFFDLYFLNNHSQLLPIIFTEIIMCMVLLVTPVEVFFLDSGIYWFHDSS